MATIQELLNQMGIKQEYVEKMASAAPAAGSNPVAEFLTKVANELGPMGEQDKLEMIKQAVEELLKEKQAGKMLSPEEEQFLAEAQNLIGGGDAGMSVMASVKQAAGLGDGPGSLDANISNQQGLMAEAFKSRKVNNYETSPSSENVTGDDEKGYQNAAAVKKDHAANAAQSGPSDSFENPKTAMAKLAQKAVYEKTVDTLADYCIEKMASDLNAIKQAEETQQQEKIAEVNKLAAAAELEGRLMARAFVDELRKAN